MPRRRRVKRILNALPSQDQAQDWLMRHAREAGVLDAAAKVPPRRDLRELWWKVGDQGATSCANEDVPSASRRSSKSTPACTRSSHGRIDQDE